MQAGVNAPNAAGVPSVSDRVAGHGAADAAEREAHDGVAVTGLP